MDCIFCKIANHEISSYPIYEDEQTYAFLDIAQDVDGHTRVIPKKHAENVLDVDDETLKHLIGVVRKIANHYVNDCGYDGVNILNASGSSAQQSVFHLHFHIIPRKKDDGIDAWPHFSSATEPLEQMQPRLKMK